MSRPSTDAAATEAVSGGRERRRTISCTMVLTPPPPASLPGTEWQNGIDAIRAASTEKLPQEGHIEEADAEPAVRPLRKRLRASTLGRRVAAMLLRQRPRKGSAGGAAHGPPCEAASDRDRITIGDQHSASSATPWDADGVAESSPTASIASSAKGEQDKGRQLMNTFQIPAYMVEAYILGSYRPLCFSARQCLQSWFYVHSELGNIITHLLGILVFAALALVTGPVVVPEAARAARAARAPADEYVVLYTYIGAVIACLAASVAFHTLACHSRRKHFQSLRCDFIGILVLIVGSFVPIGYYGFRNSPRILIGYTVAFVVVGLAGIAVSAFCHVEEPRRAQWRPIIFICISGAGLVPTIHAAVLNGYSTAVDSMSLWYVLGMCLLYFVGTVAYAFKLPERFRPGKHDVFLHSHQIFHVFVVVAALLHYVGIIRALAWVRAAHQA